MSAIGGLSRRNLKLVKRFGGEADKYGLGIVAIDCSEENLEELLNAARAEGSEPQPRALTSEREEIARIIDPDGWMTFDRQRRELAAMGRDPEGEQGPWMYVERAMRKADAILALRSPPPVVGVEKQGLSSSQERGQADAATGPAATAGQGWMPIEAAPEFEVIVVSNGEFASDAAKNPTDYGGHYWAADDADSSLGWTPTHWMPLPAAPDGAPTRHAPDSSQALRDEPLHTPTEGEG